MPRTLICFALVLVLLVALDQGSKTWADAHLASRATISSPPHYRVLQVGEDEGGLTLEELLGAHLAWATPEQLHRMAEFDVSLLGGGAIPATAQLSPGTLLRVEHYDITLIPDHLTLAYHRNSRASFALDWRGRGLDPLQLAILGVVIALSAGFALAVLPRDTLTIPSSLGAIAAGSLSNAYDRLAHEHVIDFIDTHGVLPPFNPADVFIGVGGVVLMIACASWIHRASKARPLPEPQPTSKPLT